MKLLTGTVLTVGAVALLAINPAFASTSSAAADSSAPAMVQCKGANGITTSMTEEECKKSGGVVDPSDTMPGTSSTQGGAGTDTNNSSQSTDSHQ